MEKIKVSGFVNVNVEVRFEKMLAAVRYDAGTAKVAGAIVPKDYVPTKLCSIA